MRAFDIEEHNTMLVRSLYENCINGGRLAMLEQMIDPDYAGAAGERGLEGFTASIANIRNGFPDVRFEIEDLFAQGDRVAVRWRFVATHTGPFAGRAATGKKVLQTGNVIYQVRDERILRGWLQADRLGLLQQIDG